MARTARDCALMLQAMAGRDPLDATTSSLPVPDYVAALDAPVARAPRGVPENFFFQGLDAEMEAGGARRRPRLLATLGARVAEMRLPDPQVLNDVQRHLPQRGARAPRPPAPGAAAGARRLHARPPRAGPARPGHDYLQALRLRARLARAFIREVLAEVDVLAAPVIPEPAPPLAARDRGPARGDRRSGRAASPGSRARSTGSACRRWPAVRLLAPTVCRSAFQLVGRPFDEATVLRAGHAYEQATDWHTRAPALG